MIAGLFWNRPEKKKQAVRPVLIRDSGTREKQCPGAISGADELQFNLQEQQREWTQHRVIIQRREET